MTTSPELTVECPSCGTEFLVDPGKVPVEGIPATCSNCLRVFPVERPPGYEPPAPEDLTQADPSESPDGDESTSDAGAAAAAEPVAPAADRSPFEDLSSLATEVALGTGEDDEDDEDDETEAPPSSLSKGHERFGRRDVHERAQHLARVLVSDIIAYHPARYQESLSRGTLKEDFEAEVQKSWKEYVDQVGPEMAESTPYFNEALNEVLAKGEEIF